MYLRMALRVDARYLSKWFYSRKGEGFANRERATRYGLSRQILMALSTGLS